MLIRLLLNNKKGLKWPKTAYQAFFCPKAEALRTSESNVKQKKLISIGIRHYCNLAKGII